MEEGRRILGVDPGSRTTGFGIIDVRGRSVAHVASGSLTASPALPLEARLLAIFEGLAALIDRHRPGVVCVEDVFYAQNVRSAITLGHARGVALLAAARAGLAVRPYSAAEIKMAVVGTGSAEKTQVQEMVRVLLGLARRPGPDAADALAAAICHAHRAPTLARMAAAAAPETRRATAGRPEGAGS